MFRSRNIRKNFSPFLSKEHSGLEETPQEIIKHGHYGFWLSPDGRCFVVIKMYGHGPVATIIAEEYYGRFIPNAEVFLEEKGWARVGGLPGRFTIFTEFVSGGMYRPLSNKQIDSLFDLQLSLPPGNTRMIVRYKIQDILHDMDIRANPEQILTVCAWCGDVIIEAPPGPEGEVSHGICPKCEEEYDYEDSQQEQSSKNPLDPDAWLTERHRFDAPGETADIRLGVHTTPDVDLAVMYAVHKASQQGDLEGGEPNCGIVFRLNMFELTPIAEGDAVIAAKDEDIVIDELRHILKGYNLDDPADSEEILNEIYGWSQSLEKQYHDDGFPTKWWYAYHEDIIGAFDLNKLINLIGDLAWNNPKRLFSILRTAVPSGHFPLDLWAESILQYRYMASVGLDRLLSIYAIRPVSDDLAEEDEEDDGQGPQLMSLDYLIPERRPLLISEREKKIIRDPEKYVIEYHGTDVSRARLAFPEIAEAIRCPWPYGQPRGIGLR